MVSEWYMVQSVVGDLGGFILDDIRPFIVSYQDVLQSRPSSHTYIPPPYQRPHSSHTKISRQCSLR